MPAPNRAKRTTLIPELFERENGTVPRFASKAAAKRSQLQRMELSATKAVDSAFQGGITWMDLDQVEDRYLLCGGTDTTIAAYDTHAPSAKLQPVFKVNRRSVPSAHKFLISCVAWYPVDTGMFVTGSYDNTVRVWDTNQLEVVTHFGLPAHVSNVAMSPIAASHCLLAVACLQQHVRLCDPTTGAITHVFMGHREAVWSVAWSNFNEYEFFSGDSAGQVRVWDIRRSGCRCVLDQHMTQPVRQAPPPEAPQSAVPTTTKKTKRGHTAQGAARSSSPGDIYLNPSTGVSEDLIKAHAGAVTCIAPCPDGVHMLTAGTDGRMRLWDTSYRHNCLVTYEGTHNRASRARQLAVTEDARAVFFPCGSSLEVYDVGSGAHVHTLQMGHTESINCCAYNPTLQEVYTGANDAQVLVWQSRAACAEDGAADDGDNHNGGR